MFLKRPKVSCLSGKVDYAALIGSWRASCFTGLNIPGLRLETWMHLVKTQPILSISATNTLSCHRRHNWVTRTMLGSCVRSAVGTVGNHSEGLGICREEEQTSVLPSENQDGSLPTGLGFVSGMLFPRTSAQNTSVQLGGHGTVCRNTNQQVSVSKYPVWGHCSGGLDDEIGLPLVYMFHHQWQ